MLHRAACHVVIQEVFSRQDKGIHSLLTFLTLYGATLTAVYENLKSISRVRLVVSPER